MLTSDPTTRPDRVDQLADRLTAALPQAQDPTARATFRILLELLARGEPVGVAALAETARQTESAAAEWMAQWPEIELDEAGDVVGLGLTLRPTRHHFQVDGRELYTWCAEDALIFPIALERRARVESSCPATGTPVRLTVDPEAGVIALDPAGAVISHTVPAEGRSVSEVRSVLCNHSNFFASLDVAHDYLRGKADTTVLDIASGWRLARRLAEDLL